MSRVDVEIEALGLLSFYILDDTMDGEAPRAPETPMFLGGRILRRLQAVLNYGENLMMFKDGQGDIRFMPLRVTKKWTSGRGPQSPECFI